MFRKILVGNEGSEGAFRALAVAIDVAKRYGAELHMISIEELPQFPATVGEIIEEKAEADRIFAEVAARSREIAKREGVALACHEISGHVVARIVEFVKANGVDLLVVGFMGHGRLFERVLGGTADRLVDHAPCNVLVVK